MGSCSPLQAAHCMLGEMEGGHSSSSKHQTPVKKKGGKVTEEHKRQRLDPRELANVRLQIARNTKENSEDAGGRQMFCL